MNSFGKLAITVVVSLGIVAGALAQDPHKQMNHSAPNHVVHTTTHHTVIHRKAVRHHTKHRRRRSTFKQLHSKIKTHPNGVHAPQAPRMHKPMSHPMSHPMVHKPAPKKPDPHH